MRYSIAKQLVDFIETLQPAYTQWELMFMKDVRSRIARKVKLTPAMGESLQGIYRNYSQSIYQKRQRV